jgi:ssDNA-binding Zn-finger/Zn-ribbon topoisomerase 1
MTEQQAIERAKQYGWVCDECGHEFWVASASSIDNGIEIIGGCTCPNCGAFVFTDEDEE